MEDLFKYIRWLCPTIKVLRRKIGVYLIYPATYSSFHSKNKQTKTFEATLIIIEKVIDIWLFSCLLPTNLRLKYIQLSSELFVPRSNWTRSRYSDNTCGMTRIDTAHYRNAQWDIASHLWGWRFAIQSCKHRLYDLCRLMNLEAKIQCIYVSNYEKEI